MRCERLSSWPEMPLVPGVVSAGDSISDEHLPVAADLCLAQIKRVVVLEVGVRRGDDVPHAIPAATMSPAVELEAALVERHVAFRLELGLPTHRVYAPRGVDQEERWYVRRPLWEVLPGKAHHCADGIA